MSLRTILSLTACVAFTAAPAAEWPQYRGPNGDGITDDKILTTWPNEGPKALWKIPMGEGFGCVAAVGGRGYVMAEREGDEACVAIDIATGKELWSTKLGKTIFEKQGGNGPRATPTVVGDHVYILGTYLRVSCLSAKDGKVVWSHDVKADNAGQVDTKGISNWGNAASAVVEGDVVLVAGGGAGQTFIAFDRKTGKILGKGGDEKITHASPTPTTIHGQKQVIFFTQQGLTSLDPKGSVLWQASFPWSVSTAASPVVEGDMVYCSAGYGVGAGAFKIAKQGATWKASEVWRKKGEHQNHWSTPIVYKGHLYGLFGFKEYKTMPLKCIELATGQEKWSESGFGQGGNILVGENVLTLGDQGQLVLSKATPDKYTELARAQVLSGKCWNNPSVANGLVICRSTKEIVCLDLRVK